MFEECRLFQARDFVSLLGPCILMCRFCGVFPYKIKSDRREIVNSNWRFICSLIVMLATILILGYILYQLDFVDVLDNINVPGLLQGNCYLSLSFLISIFSMFYINSKLKFLQQLNAISSKYPEKIFVKISRVIHAKDIFGFIFLITQIINVRRDKTIETLKNAFGLYITATVYTLDMIYVDCVYVIYAGFKNVNKNLEDLRKYINEKPYLLRRDYHRYHNPIILSELKSLKAKHHELSECVQQLNNVSGFHVGITVVLTFTEVTFSIYFVILREIANKNFEFNNQFSYWHFVRSVTYQFIKFLVIIFTCDKAKNESLRTGNLIHEMLIRIADFDVKQELHLFSLQLLHRSNTFDGRGITIDARLLKGVVGGIATYILILMQFLLSSRK